MALIDLRMLPERVKPGKSFQIAAKKEDPRPPSGQTKGGWNFSGDGVRFLQAREAARVAHEDFDQPTSSRSPTPESDRWCSSR
jgi:hypothetical protein